ncbi:isochorismatase family protein [Budvicia aquatica]|uniref:Cysteine hydrolase n=1 Tax=Budvicia aquatica TaxID=82979 RepID=A0A2C6DJS5_9GAMM|nr:isochorismatase family protein [Budvicia aquatica]PHI30568.1 cysteine hydrolase [Budvicia aquatica]VFS49946.1 Isochorismatase family protein yecD [Budvicia aquatica]
MATALLLIDVQNAILSNFETGEKQQQLDQAFNFTLDQLSLLKAKATAAEVPVFIVQHDGKVGHRLEKGTSGWEIHPKIAAVKGDILIAKKTNDSFFETDLAKRLSQFSVDRLIVGGFMTQYCVDIAARKAVFFGYNVTLVADGHLTANSQSMTFQQIVAHHNNILPLFKHQGRGIEVRPAKDIHF